MNYPGSINTLRKFPIKYKSKNKLEMQRKKTKDSKTLIKWHCYSDILLEPCSNGCASLCSVLTFGLTVVSNRDTKEREGGDEY